MHSLVSLETFLRRKKKPETLQERAYEKESFIEQLLRISC